MPFVDKQWDDGAGMGWEPQHSPGASRSPSASFASETPAAAVEPAEPGCEPGLEPAGAGWG